MVGLNITAGVLSWFQVTATEITAQHHVIATGETQRGNQYPLPHANFRIGDIVQAGADAVIYSDKQGQVVRLERTGQTALLFATHDATPDGQPRIVPWELGIDQRRSSRVLKRIGFALSVCAAVLYLKGLPFGAFHSPLAN
ncbi:hypothetical protein CXB77_06635 [Chromatium okenii]|uniref:Uncharacterized protein n=1 Tax=Chromatium okenii TaxID=61644 RepID=A0A2S7XSY5_9GAMM|nr:hypothetical protein CXB77_06635 [Chromatium okenii]